MRESNPYRLLGLSTEATFEEIQDARNYYFEVCQRLPVNDPLFRIDDDDAISDLPRS